MKYKLLRIIWKDIIYFEALLSREEAPDMIKPINIITLGFKINENADSIALAQTYNITNDTFLKTSIIPKTLIVSTSDLKNRETTGEKETGIGVVKWLTENKYFSKSYTKAKAEELLPLELATVGFIVPQEEYYSMFFERDEDGINLTRAEQRIYKREIKSLEYVE
jgi:hypothetical protein